MGLSGGLHGYHHKIDFNGSTSVLYTSFALKSVIKCIYLSRLHDQTFKL